MLKDKKLFESKELIRIMTVRKHQMCFARKYIGDYKKLNLKDLQLHDNEVWKISFTRNMALGEITSLKPNEHTQLLIMQLERMGLSVEYRSNAFWKWEFEVKCPDQSTMKKLCSDIINSGYQFHRLD